MGGDKKVYGSKSINKIRISQEKKLKELRIAMLRWGDHFKFPTEADSLTWRNNFTSILRLETYLSSGLNNVLTKKDIRLANELYRKYLGFVK